MEHATTHTHRQMPTRREPDPARAADLPGFPRIQPEPAGKPAPNPRVLARRIASDLAFTAVEIVAHFVDGRQRSFVVRRASGARAIRNYLAWPDCVSASIIRRLDRDEYDAHIRANGPPRGGARPGAPRVGRPRLVPRPAPAATVPEPSPAPAVPGPSPAPAVPGPAPALPAAAGPVAWEYLIRRDGKPETITIAVAPGCKPEDLAAFALAIPGVDAAVAIRPIDAPSS